MVCVVSLMVYLIVNRNSYQHMHSHYFNTKLLWMELMFVLVSTSLTCYTVYCMCGNVKKGWEDGIFCLSSKEF